ncbi:MAG: T9SS type A sorting domain-containing protein [Lewinellaceae bacterium]|nr:T9SS type A sorting domain-containing protein [Saprospiraceae bacterium]MCB9337099.1 T9SS type A sorting domain-containing protein [Lewinellaceae bacterium]
MNKGISLLLITLSIFQAGHLPAQISYTANDTVIAYPGHFRYGVNMGAYYGWRDENLADIAAGNPAENVEGIGINALRPLLSEWFLEYWGYDIRVDAFQHYDKLGIQDNVVFIGYPSETHRDTTHFCPDGPSQLFANMYLPIWDNGENGTPVNDSNFYAAYVYKMASLYHPYVKYWEVWNEPDFDFVGNSSKQPGEDGNWWEHDPQPCQFALHAPIEHYIRLLRITYEVIKTVAPDDFVAIGGIGYPSFLDVVLRKTDNPVDGSADSLYPLKGGAYFDVVSYHSYPHIDNSLRAWDDQIFGFKYFRHSDRCVDGMIARQSQMRGVLEKYGYDGETFPQKHWILTETNIPRVRFDEFIGTEEAQRNYLIKAFVTSQINGIDQVDIYQLGDIKTYDGSKSEFFTMGLYYALDSVPQYEQRVTQAGIATRTTAMMLKNKRFDADKTAAMQLPGSIRGGAFRDDAGKYTYVLWAVTQTDNSEDASAVYAFPASFNINSLYSRAWNFGQIGITTVSEANQVELTGSPIFLTNSRDEIPSEEIRRVNIFCSPNPFGNQLFVKLDLPESMVSSLALFDMQGKLVANFFSGLKLAQGSHTLELDGREIPSGLYALRFESTGGRRVVEKIIKN